MPRIQGEMIPDKKRLLISLTYILGIGRPTAQKLVDALGLDPNMEASRLTGEEIAKISSYIDKELLTGGRLLRKVQADIQTQIANGSYRGLRHRLKMPCRGQSTQRNARTRRGKRRAVAGKKKAPSKK